MTKGWPNSIDSRIASLPFVTRRLSVQGNSISITTRRHSIGHTVPFTFNSPMRLRDASQTIVPPIIAHLYANTCSSHMRISSVPFREYLCKPLTWTNLISSRFVNNTTFEFYPCFERFGYNSHWWRFVSFPLFFHTEKEIYILLENCRKFLTTKGTREGISVYKNYLSKSLFLEISRKEERKVDPFVAFIESFLNASVNSRYNRRRKGPPYTNTRISTRVILIALCAHNG